MEQFRGGLLDAIDFVRKQNENSVKKCEKILQTSCVRKRRLYSRGIYTCIASKSASLNIM